MKAHSGSRSIVLLLGVSEWLTPRPSHFTREKEIRYSFYKRLGGPQGRSGRVRKISPGSGFVSRKVQPLASHYTL